jgi:hypothetical protein
VPQDYGFDVKGRVLLRREFGAAPSKSAIELGFGLQQLVVGTQKVVGGIEISRRVFAGSGARAQRQQCYDNENLFHINSFID